MENQNKEDHGGNETEEFPYEFKCCVCLDLFYKPVVLACGHISCFWCVFKAMDSWEESQCPVCRQPYSHFPSICILLHFLLPKLYPLAYERREREVLEEEMNFGFFSPQFGDYLSESHSSKEFDTGSSPRSTAISHNKLRCESCSGGEGEPFQVKDSSETIVPNKVYAKLHFESCSKGEGEPSQLKDSSATIVPNKVYGTTVPTPSSYKATGNIPAQENSMLGNKLVHGTCNRVHFTDLLCAACKQLLCRPIVLNCGHAFCEACIINPGNKVCRCPVCQSLHPNGFPKVCLILEHFLEEKFSEEYAARKEAVPKQVMYEHGSPPTSQAQQHDDHCSLSPTKDYSSLLSGLGTKVHVAVGCDYCGMYPIIGERYKCKDCKEKIGFDLCGECYKSNSKLPGRFNQQHTPDHEFEIVLGTECYEEDDSDDTENLEYASPTPNSSGDAPLDQEAGPLPSFP